MSGLGKLGGIANGGFEQSAPFGGYGWRYYTDEGVTRIEDSGKAHSGDYFLQLTNGAQSHQPAPANDGDTVTVFFWLHGEEVGEGVDVTIDFRDQNMWTTPLQTTTDTFNPTTDWAEHEMTVVAPTDTPNPVYHTRLTFTAGNGATVNIDDVRMEVTSISYDYDPPAPDPLTWQSPPSADGPTSITMTATAAVDMSGVEYFFECVSGACNNSGWQPGQVYTDTGLTPDTQYSYRAQARDLSENQNATEFSSPETATTDMCASERVHVESIEASLVKVEQGNKVGRATVVIYDNCGTAVSGAAVTGTFAGDFNEIGSASTTSTGVAVIETQNSLKGKVEFSFCVENVVVEGLEYDTSNSICATN